MNFLSVINGIDLETFGGMLSYDKETKELTFTSEDGKTYKCYANSMSALVNFMKHIVPVMGVEVNNVNAAYLIFMSIVGENENIIKQYIKLPITANGLPLGSYVQWLKIAIDTVQILDNLEHINGTWSSVYSLSGLTAGNTYGPKVESSFAGTINWGDGTSSEVGAGDYVNHLYNKDGNYTITIEGPALARVNYDGEGGTQNEGLTTSKTPFNFKNTPTA